MYQTGSTKTLKFLPLLDNTSFFKCRKFHKNHHKFWFLLTQQRLILKWTLYSKRRAQIKKPNLTNYHNEQFEIINIFLRHFRLPVGKTASKSLQRRIFASLSNIGGKMLLFFHFCFCLDNGKQANNFLPFLSLEYVLTFCKLRSDLQSLGLISKNFKSFLSFCICWN